MVRLRQRLAAADVFRHLLLQRLVGQTILLAVGAGLLSTAAGCNENSPTSPSENITITGLKVRGCAESEGHKCQAFATFSDGAEKDVTARTQWENTPWLIVSVEAGTGRVTPRFVGTTVIRGTVNGGLEHGKSGEQRIDVTLPPVQLRGTVRDQHSGRDLAGARMEVVSGPSAGTATIADAGAVWTLTVPPTTHVKVDVSHPGYLKATWELSLWDRDISTTPYNLKLEQIGTPRPPPAPVPPPPPPSPPYQITQDFAGRIDGTYSSTDPFCRESRFEGRNLPCRTFTLPPSPHRLLDVELTWTRTWDTVDVETEIGFEVLRGTFLVARSENDIARAVARIPVTDILGEQPYEIRVLLLEGRGPMAITLKTRRSNPHPY